MVRKRGGAMAACLGTIACYLIACTAQSPEPAKEEAAAQIVAQKERAPDFYLQAERYENPNTSLPAHWTRFHKRLQGIVQKRDLKALQAQLDKAVRTPAGTGQQAFLAYWDSLPAPWALLEKDMNRAGAFDNKDETLFSIPYWVLRSCPQSDCWRLPAGTALFAAADSQAAAIDTAFVARPLDIVGAELPVKDWYQIMRLDSSRVYVRREQLESRKNSRQLAFERQGKQWRLFLWK